MGEETVIELQRQVAAGGLLNDADNERLQKHLRHEKENAAHLARFGVRLQDTPAKDYPPRWQDCEDLEVRDEWGQLVWAGPRYLRCSRVECHMLVTHGMIAQGGCWCGNRRLGVALRLTKEEAAHLQAGYYPLLPWEAEQIQPTLPDGKLPGWGKAEDAQKYA